MLQSETPPRLLEGNNQIKRRIPLKYRCWKKARQCWKQSMPTSEFIEQSPSQASSKHWHWPSIWISLLQNELDTYKNTAGHCASSCVTPSIREKHLFSREGSRCTCFRDKVPNQTEIRRTLCCYKISNLLTAVRCDGILNLSEGYYRCISWCFMFAFTV